MPSAFTVATEGYALSRRLYLYLPVERLKPPTVEALLIEEGRVTCVGFRDEVLARAGEGGEQEERNAEAEGFDPVLALRDAVVERHLARVEVVRVERSSDPLDHLLVLGMFHASH